MLGDIEVSNSFFRAKSGTISNAKEFDSAYFYVAKVNEVDKKIKGQLIEDTFRLLDLKKMDK